MRFNGAKEGYDYYRIPALVATLTIKTTDDDFNSVTKILVDEEGGYCYRGRENLRPL